MKTGYSNLLGEYLKAEDLEYPDCKGFQVVCPVCREPVFKVLRSGELALHYLAHYAAQKSFAADCELRVGSLNSVAAEKHNAASRGQRLAYFLKVLRKAVSELYYSGGEKEASAAQAEVNHSKALVGLRKAAFFAMQTGRDLFLEQFLIYADSYIEEGLSSDDPVWKTGFSMAVQVRIAKDMLASLLTSTGKENFLWLWNHAYQFFLYRQYLARQAGTQPPIFAEMEGYLRQLLQSSHAEGRNLIRRMANIPMYPPHVREPGTRMNIKVLAEISHEMIGSLIRLPYFDLLREAKTPFQTCPHPPLKEGDPA